MNIKEKTYILSDVAGAYTRATLLVRKKAAVDFMQMAECGSNGQLR
jgi:hypothetical protein